MESEAEGVFEDIITNSNITSIILLLHNLQDDGNDNTYCNDPCTDLAIYTANVLIKRQIGIIYLS